MLNYTKFDKVVTELRIFKKYEIWLEKAVLYREHFHFHKINVLDAAILFLKVCIWLFFIFIFFLLSS